MNHTEYVGLLNELQPFLSEKNRKATLELLQPLHPADIAELFDDLDQDHQLFIISILENESSAAVLLELEEDDRGKLLNKLSAKEIAREVIYEMDSDDAVDVISELSTQKKHEVISQLHDDEQAKDIVDLMRYDDNSAGGLMGKEFVKVNKSWNVITAIREMRKQAEDMDEVYSIYVVDDSEKLLGTLSLKKILTSSSRTILDNLYNSDIHYVNTDQPAEEVAQSMQKYDLFELPVVDEANHLVGQITVDDVLDFIRDEADKDYQMASGISEDVDMSDNLWSLTKARFPWLLIGVFGSLLSSFILDRNLHYMEAVPFLILFIPLIAATAGNMGVQSSAIVVQALANGSLKSSTWKNISKEISLGLISGVALALLLFIFNVIVHGEILLALTISLALCSVVVTAAVIGTLVPIILNKKGIDPAIATGPFITTSNDVIGLIIYFLIAKFLLGI